MKVNSANVKHISLQPGMYVFNYVRSLTPNSTPVTVFSKRPHFGSGTMSCLYSNEKVDGQLSAPGECVVIRVGQNSIQLQVSIYDDQCSNPDVEFKIDTLFQQKPIISKTLKSSRPDEKKLETLKDLQTEILKAKKVQANKTEVIPLALSGHVEWKGDVKKKAGKWLGSASGSKRIEAFAIDWPERPKGVNVKYTCMVKNLGSLPSVKCGEMIGTTQRALPIEGIRVALKGKNSKDYLLKIQAAFSESGAQQRQGVDEELKALHENEFLTGLKIDIIKKVPQAMLPNTTKEQKQKKGKKQKKRNNWDNFDDVMVFKG